MRTLLIGKMPNFFAVRLTLLAPFLLVIVCEKTRFRWEVSGFRQGSDVHDVIRRKGLEARFRNCRDRDSFP
jgi:hypothetical protein